MVVTVTKKIISLQHEQLQQQHSSDGNDYHEGDDEVTTSTTTATTEISKMPELKPLNCFQT